MCQMPNIWHTKKHLTADVLNVANIWHLCPYRCKFATVQTQMLKPK